MNWNWIAALLAWGHELQAQTKVIAATLLAGVALLADATDAMGPWKLFDEMTVKVAFGGAAWILWKVLQKERAEHKIELQKERAEHKVEMTTLRERHETRMETVIKENTASNKAVVEKAEEQVNYFKTMTRHVMDERLNKSGQHESQHENKDKKDPGSHIP